MSFLLKGVCCLSALPFPPAQSRAAGFPKDCWDALHQKCHEFLWACQQNSRQKVIQQSLIYCIVINFLDTLIGTKIFAFMASRERKRQ
jgi:hypothetical protein